MSVFDFESKGQIQSLLEGEEYNYQDGNERFKCILQVLFNVNVEMGGNYFELLELAILNLSKSSLSIENKIGYFWLAFAGSLLPESLLTKLRDHCEEDFQKKITSGVISLLRKSPKILQTKERIKLVPTPKDCLLVDVSHTHHYPFISGVQRVVRQTVAEFQRNSTPYTLVKFKEQINFFELLAEDEKDQFLSFSPLEHHADRSKSAVKGLSRYLFRIIKGVLRKLSLIQRLALTSEQDIKGVVAVPLIYKSNLALLEVIYDQPRVNAYVSLKRSFDVNMSMVCYDLIPVLEPEYCAVSQPFINYLRVLRAVSNISCISLYSKEIFEKFLVLVQHQSPLSVKAIALAGEGAPQIKNASNETASSTPIVLCVGTIEPRKNQIGILRAAMGAWKKGKSFRMIFAGNLGFNSDFFMEELNQAIDEGWPVEFRNGPSENELKGLYRSCTFTMFCSHSEGFGLPVIESLHYGKPCITSSTTSLKELGELGGCIMVNPQSILEISSALIKLLEDQDIYKALRNQAEKIPIRTWSQYARETYEFMTEQK